MTRLELDSWQRDSPVAVAYFRRITDLDALQTLFRTLTKSSRCWLGLDLNVVDVSVRMSPSRNMQDFKDLLFNVWAPEDKGQRSPGVCTLKAQSSCGSESLHNIQGVVSMLWLISSVKRFHICVHAFVFFYIRTITTVNMKICAQDAFVQFFWLHTKFNSFLHSVSNDIAATRTPYAAIYLSPPGPQLSSSQGPRADLFRMATRKSNFPFSYITLCFVMELQSQWHREMRNKPNSKCDDFIWN